MTYVPELTHAQTEALRAQAELLTAQRHAPPSNDGLLQTVALVRQRHLDPKDEYYAGHPDRVAASEMQMQATLIRAGVTEPVVTAQSLAVEQPAGHWTMSELHPAVAAMITERVAALDKLGEREVTERAKALRTQIGAADYDAMVAAAGPLLPPAATADLYALKLHAAHGRYRSAADASKPKI